MKKVRLEAGSNEWHLVDEDDTILLNITDTDICYANTEKELLEAIDNVWDEAFESIEYGREYNGVAQGYLDDDWMFVVAKRLFEHYGYDTAFLERVTRFRNNSTLGFELQKLNILDWYILLEEALQS